jgi:raffinose/stachyose/melibiose transport system substrate-binding protein
MWKDTTYPEESKKFLEYLSQVENCEKVATSSGDIPGLKDVKNEDAYITQAFREAQTMYKGDIEYVPLFDREYLPSGMWDDLGVGMTKLIMEPGKAVKDSVEYLQDAYNNKMIK